jgi:hypothetical protein
MLPRDPLPAVRQAAGFTHTPPSRRPVRKRCAGAWRGGPQHRSAVRPSPQPSDRWPTALPLIEALDDGDSQRVRTCAAVARLEPGRLTDSTPSVGAGTRGARGGPAPRRRRLAAVRLCRAAARPARRRSRGSTPSVGARTSGARGGPAPRRRRLAAVRLCRAVARPARGRSRGSTPAAERCPDGTFDEARPTPLLGSAHACRGLPCAPTRGRERP